MVNTAHIRQTNPTVYGVIQRDSQWMGLRLLMKQEATSKPPGHGKNVT